MTCGAERECNITLVIVVGGLVSLNRLKGVDPFDWFDRIGMFDCLYRLFFLHRLHWVCRFRTLGLVGSVSPVGAVVQIDPRGDGGRLRLSGVWLVSPL
jgi:hypothetical protein